MAVFFQHGLRALGSWPTISARKVLSQTILVTVTLASMS